MVVLLVYDVRSATVRVGDAGTGRSKDVQLTRRKMRLGESLVRLGFFEMLPYHC